MAEPQNVAANHGHITFSAGNHRWHVRRVGESYLYQVPENKFGHLAQFRATWLGSSVSPLAQGGFAHTWQALSEDRPLTLMLL